ncbi:MAG: hypothetical protein EXR05_02510 [Acetobacteraceae bacterium]|nr:hypothetical protein [Acetobacteraceae bacterium]
MIAARPDTAREEADIIRRDQGQGASIWVVNHEIVTYLLLEFPIPTQFVSPHFLTGPFGAVTRIDTDAEVKRILLARPRYLAVDPTQWKRTTATMIHIVRQEIRDHYALLAARSAAGFPLEICKLRPENDPPTNTSPAKC